MLLAHVPMGAVHRPDARALTHARSRTHMRVLLPAIREGVRTKKVEAKKESLDDDLDSYFGSKDAPEGVKSKKEEASKGGLDDDLDSYFAAKSAPAEPAAE